MVEESRLTPQQNESGAGGTSDSQSTPQLVEAPSISLSKSGGAIHGVGKKLTPNPFTVTASFSVPIFISPGRSGFQPDLSLSYVDMPHINWQYSREQTPRLAY